jgi:thiamine biosynthesis protein ThiS
MSNRQMESAGTKTIEVVVNGEPKRAPEGLDVARLLAWLAIDGSRVAVELNRAVVRKTEWNSTPVVDGSQIEIVWFVGGGSRHA